MKAEVEDDGLIQRIDLDRERLDEELRVHRLLSPPRRGPDHVHQVPGSSKDDVRVALRLERGQAVPSSS